MIINQLTFLLLFCLLGWSDALIRPVPGISMSDRDGRTLQRTKRGWMWNSFFLLEEWTGTGKQYVGKLHSDMDHEDGNVKYVLTGDGAGTVFEIDENSGDIHATRRLDREEKALYTLSAKAVNKTSGQDLERASEFIIKIHDINDNEPKFAKDTYVASVSEMSNVGAFVMRVTATDADDEAYGNSAKLVYSILQGQPYFSVEPETGVIRTALPNMIRENREHYQVVIQAKDMAGQMGGLSGTTTVNITLQDVNNSPPRFPHSKTTHTLLLHACVDLKETSSLPNMIRENREHYQVVIQAKDMAGQMGGLSGTTTVNITLQDVNNSPPRFPHRFLIDCGLNTLPSGRSNFCQSGKEKATAKKLSYDISATEGMWETLKPAGRRYTIDRHTDLERLFSIDSNNGTISTLQGLDRETSKWHNISVLATELSTALQTRVPVFIKVRDVNDNAPEFAMYYETFVCENVKAGQLIQTISAVDTDEPLVGHKFVFSLSTINPNFTIFDNEDNTARILTRRGSFNRREMSSYLLPVVISDNDYPIQSSTSTLTVRVCACDSRGNVQTCSNEALLLSAGLSTGALVAILLCILILLMIVVLFAALRRQKKKEPLIISKEDVRDNVVSYNDEGGGEEDTQAFDIGTLRNPEVIDTNKLRRDIMPEMLFPFRRTSPIKDNTDVRDFINGRLQENDSDPTAPPYDSLATYAYEGNGSLAESLSSLESAATEGDQEFEYLSHWGPQFKKLADMYIGQESQRET
ncbi:cadherin-10-like [Sinocyclocheilus grahami]|uniref:cadherin-10-like n=1 Tax=Sinocyclocheilus grahami TaxID=75366 RepID=UPI0007AD1CDA|nr:PREDICTED: cadherin-10-like [Sinocyclocheilus grahami]